MKTEPFRISTIDAVIAGAVMSSYQSALILRQLKGLPDSANKKERDEILEEMYATLFIIAGKIREWPDSPPNPSD